MSATESSTREVILAELADLLAPLAALSSPKDVERLINALGWDFPAITEVPDDFTLLVDGVGDVRSALVELEAAETDDELESAGGALLTAVAEVLAGAAGLGKGISGGFAELGEFVNESGLAADLPRRLLDLVIVDYVIHQHPAIGRLLVFLGLIDFVTQDADDTRHRVDAIIPTFYWERIPQLFSNPGQVLNDVYGWSTDFQASKFLARAMGFGIGLGLPSRETPQPQALADALQRPPDPRTEYLIALLQSGSIVSAGSGEIGVRLCDIPASGSLGAGIAMMPYAAGEVELQGEIAPGWNLTITTALDVTAGVALTLRPPGTAAFRTDLLGGPAVATGKLTVGVRRSAPPDTEIVLLGAKGKTRLALREFGVAMSGTLDGQPVPELVVSVDVVSLTIAVVPGDGDGFLQKVLPPDGIKASGDLGLDASTRSGFKFRGGGGFEVELPLKLDLGGVVELKTLWTKVSVDSEGLKYALALTVVVTLGPITGVVERIGIQGTAKPQPNGQAGNFGPLDLSTKFKPPSGVGLSISAGPVTGGGYIFFDPENEQYAGILSLSFKTIGLTVIGLLTTRLPDPSGAPGATQEGFSLLLIITFDLPPIQLGYGFTLNGVGGLLGVNRTMLVDPLRNGVRNGTVDSILFPSNPVARAAEIISNLRSIFPPTAGRYLFGPMVKIGWGPNALLEIQAAVVLELTAPIRLVILGKVQVALPDKKNGIAVLRLDIVGVIDFDQSQASVDASLVDSRIAAFAITGDMAMRLGWGATKMFALAAGGFYPKFQPPTGFPQLNRLAISLANSDNPLIRLESYFALTANTIQFGADMDISAKMDTPVGTFSFSALANFDALIQFQPFSLQADLGASIDISRNGTPLLHAALSASLTGPGPWHATGYAEFDFLGKHRIPFDATAGEPAPRVPVTVSVGDLGGNLAAALGRPDAWAALPPEDSDRIVSLRNQPGSGMLVHPLGALAVRQRVLPFDKIIQRFGSAVVDTPVTFSLVGFAIGSGATNPAAETLQDDFAPGQFTPLTDDESVTRPAFEAMPSGGRIDVASFLVPADAPGGTAASMDYQDAIVDYEPTLFGRVAKPLAAGRTVLSGDMIQTLAAAGAAGRAATRAGGAKDFASRNLAVGVGPERYVAADVNTLAPLAGTPAAGTSWARSQDTVAANPTGSQVALLQEAA